MGLGSALGPGSTLGSGLGSAPGFAAQDQDWDQHQHWDVLPGIRFGTRISTGIRIGISPRLCCPGGSRSPGGCGTIPAPHSTQWAKGTWEFRDFQPGLALSPWNPARIWGWNSHPAFFQAFLTGFPRFSSIFPPRRSVFLWLFCDSPPFPGWNSRAQGFTPGCPKSWERSQSQPSAPGWLRPAGKRSWSWESHRK